MRIDGAGLPASPAAGGPHPRKSSAPAVPGSSPGVAAGEGLSPFARLLRGLGAEVEQGESLAHAVAIAARQGAPPAPAELIALEASVFRYSEALDLAARLVDRSTSAVKTVLQGQ